MGWVEEFEHVVYTLLATDRGKKQEIIDKRRLEGESYEDRVGIRHLMGWDETGWEGCI